MLNLDDAFLDRMKQLLGAEYGDFVSALNKPMQKAICVNQNKISVKDFISLAPFNIEQIPYEKAGFYTENIKLGKHPLHMAGAFYSQEPSAMWTVNTTSFNGDEYVLDMCAAPGGKSIQIANRIPNGLLVSNEINNARAKILYSNIERMGLNNVMVTNNTPEQIAKAYANSFDVCLVDAPCSAEGMFRREEKYAEGWNENLPKMCAERQLEILHNADIALKEGGKLIYSTCTYSLEENEEVVKQFISTHDYKLIDIKADLPRGIGLEQAVRLYPHKVRGEGQFVCVMQKTSKNDAVSNANLKLKEDVDFVNFAKTNLNKQIKGYIFNNSTYYIKDTSMVKMGVNYLSVGVKLGVKDKNGFKPDHYLYSAFGANFKNIIELTYVSKEALNFLHGDILPTNLPDGYGAVLIDGCAAGGFKISNGQFKNHYPKGLRI